MMTLPKQFDAKTKMNKSNSSPILPPINSPLNSPTLEASKLLVLTKNDLERINGHLNKRQQEEEAALDELRRKKELHEKSLALTRNWNNTIDGSRRHKLQQKKIREEKLEEKRRQVDLEHAEYMAEQRRKAIEQAKLLQYHETDRIKTFHSALKYTEVLKEREAQLEIKKILEQLNKIREDEIDKQAYVLLQAKYKEDEEAYRKKQDELRKVFEHHKKQIQEHEHKREQEKDQVRRDAEALRVLSEQYQLEREQLEMIRLRKMRELKDTYDNALANRRKMVEAEKMIDEEENEEIRVYAAAKKKLANIKYQKEREAEREKEDRREKIMANLGSMLKTQVEDEEFRIAKAVAKNEAKLAQEELFKEMKFRKELAEIHQHRIETIKRKEEEKSTKQKEDEESMKKKIETDMMYQMFELEQNKLRQQKMNDISKTNLKLTNDRKDLEGRIRKADKEFVLKEIELMNLEDKQFEDYATRVIEYMDAHGRNTYPMKKVLNDVIKPINPVDERSQASLIKKHLHDVPSNKNLGFM
ncbi:unnamed protein product [Brachionus calyciflorus]|uniref:Trichohyalin-plectin-homology domain-containing protein n=1 Tax=Brachionus calyciflorus TaxID=104777 RepID=A0A813RM87_9BILA|nr:unnamed protein product [Brachionus calyciflorus]